MRSTGIKELQTILGEDIPVTTRGIVYLGILLPDKLVVKRTLMFDNHSDALNAYSNIPNPESQLVMGKTFDELITELHKLHERMKTKEWIEQLHDCI